MYSLSINDLMNKKILGILSGVVILIIVYFLISTVGFVNSTHNRINSQNQSSIIQRLL